MTISLNGLVCIILHIYASIFKNAKKQRKKMKFIKKHIGKFADQSIYYALELLTQPKDNNRRVRFSGIQNAINKLHRTFSTLSKKLPKSQKSR